MTSNTLTKPDFDAKAFVPAEYNNTYYATVMEDEQKLVDWQATDLDEIIGGHLANRGLTQFSHHIEAGSGPAVHHLFALEKYSEEIQLTEFLPDNLAEIARWVGRDPTAHDWQPFVRAILEAEGLTASEDAVRDREERVRSKIASYRPLDLKNPTAEMRGYIAPFVTSFFVADSATDDKRTFRHMTKNAFNIVEPGGLFVGAYLGECERYAVGDRWVNSANLTEQDLEDTFEGVGAVDLTITRFETPDLEEEGFDHIFAVTAKAA